MSKEDFQELLQAMPQIAEAVKALPPELQQRAFDELIVTFKGQDAQPSRVGAQRDAPDESMEFGYDATPGDKSAPEQTGASARPSKAGARRPKPKQTAAVRDYNFWPDGKQSLPDFIGEKTPTTMHQKNLLITYWLEEVAVEGAIGTGLILAAYKAANWRAPADPDNSLQVTASLKHWIDTSDMKAIKTTHGGRMFVEHELPSAATTAKRVVKKAPKK